MPSTVKHSIVITPIGIDGIIVYDNKRPRGKPPQQLNKISAIASLSRNRKTKTTLPTLPLVPDKNDRHYQGGLRYMTLWDSHNNEQQQYGIDHEILFETNLHRRSRSRRNTFDQNFDAKTYEVVIGLKRGQETIALAVSVLNIYGPTNGSIELELPLCPMGNTEYMQRQPSIEDLDDDGMSVGASSFVRSTTKNPKSTTSENNAWDMEPIYFDEDTERSYLLARNASMKVNIEIMDSRCKYSTQYTPLSLFLDIHSI
jgi:hypothetical protein